MQEHHRLSTLIIILCCLLALPLTCKSTPDNTNQMSLGETQRLATEAYIYAYPLVLMHVSKQVMTNVTTPDSYSGHAPINQFAHFKQVLDSNYKSIARMDVDTLYSVAWLDLSQQPIILSVPDTHGRYYFMSILDAWTNVFADPGKRTTGTNAANFIIVGPQWHGSLPAGLLVYYAPTNLVTIVARIQVNDPTNLSDVYAMQNGFKLTPLNLWHKNITLPESAVDSTIDMQTSPAMQVNQMDAVSFFKLFAELLKNNPPPLTDTAMLSELQNMGIVPGQDFVTNRLTAQQIKGLNLGMLKAQQLLAKQIKKLGLINANWQFMPMDTGNYGTDYLTRAVIALYGLGSNIPDDVIAPLTGVDVEGKQLNGESRYILHFTPEQAAVANAFWSVTLYGEDNFFAANPLNRYALNSQENLQYNSDGSLDIYLQHDSPGSDKETNWLPAPEGNFNVTLRIYWPKPAAMDANWEAPVIMRSS